MRTELACVLLAVCLGLTACAGKGAMPGGDETVNLSYYGSADDFRSRIDRLAPGMGESEVLAILGRTRDDMILLSREEVIKALYGGGSIQVMNDAVEREQTRLFLQSLYGYSMTFKDVTKKHGFSSPIRIQTEENGYDYTVKLLFQNGVLMERPVVAGGIVHGTSSKTFFDYLNPGSVLDATR